jgi:DNA polymerase-3 subunit beta
VRFRVGRDALGEAVAFVSRALPSRPVVPVLSGMLLDAGPDGLVLSCFDYEVSARVRVDAEVEEPGTALVPGRLLAEITRSLPASPVEFSDEAGMVNLACGSAEFGLVCLPVGDYPALPASPEPVGTVDSAALASAIAQVAPAASRDDTLPMLTAVCLDISGSVMTLVATDRYRLAARELAFEPSTPGVAAIALVPSRIMTEVGRTMAPGLPVAVALGMEGLISLEAGGRRLTARLISGEFIKYQARFPTEFGCRADVPAGPMIEAVRRAALVAERAGPVQLSFGAGQVVIEAHAEGRARAADTVAAEFFGDQPVISFNPHYLLDGLTAAASMARPTTPSTGSAGSGGSGVRSRAGGAADVAGPADVAGSVETAGPAKATGAAKAAKAAKTPGTASAAAGADGASSAETIVAVAGAGTAVPEAGRIRIEFTSPAKPALITWTEEIELDPGADAESTSVPAFRYLLVPLRAPIRA